VTVGKAVAAASRHVPIYATERLTAGLCFLAASVGLVAARGSGVNKKWTHLENLSGLFYC
jgi:hypothetical protein